MIAFLKEFFGFGGYQREPEGAYSWQHLVFISSALLIMTVLAVVLGIVNRMRDEKSRNRVLIVSAILIDSFELFKIVIMCFSSGNPWHWLNNLPLFLCSIQLITIPIAAFAKGRIKAAALDFVFIFGILGAVLGTVGAAQNYNAYPVLSFDNVVSAITHCISGFASLYILFARLETLKRKNIWITFSILFGFCAAAYITNILIDYNYMFLMSHDGTPYSIIYALVGGSPVLYPITVVLLFVIYIAIFYGTYYLSTKKKTAE